MALFKEAEDMVGICGALDATAEVVMAEGDAVQAAELLKEAVKKGKETKMKDGERAWGAWGAWDGGDEIGNIVVVGE